MRKSDQICARVTPEDLTALREQAARHGVLLSEFVRRTLLEKLDGQTTGKPSNDTEDGQMTEPGFRYYYR